MRLRLPNLSRKLLVVPPVIIGVVLLVVLVQTRTGSPRQPEVETARAVRTIRVPVVNVLPRAIGYGRIRPTLTWHAVAEVSGTVLDTHELYEEGAIVPKGTELVRIDPVDYELAVEQASANIQELQAQLAELDAQKTNDEASLEIEQRSLDLIESDLKRQHEMLAAKTVSQAVVDEAERRALAQRTTVQRLRNSLNLLPARRRAFESRLASQEAKLRIARRDLGRTRIVAPFDARVTSVTVQKDGYASKGGVLVTADGTASMEVPAQFQIDKVRRLLPAGESIALRSGFDSRQLPGLLRVSATVRLRDGEFVVGWAARFARIAASLDPRTRTVGFIVIVDEPYEQARTGTRPPLMRGMFVEVELRGPPLSDRVVVPRSSLHGNEVYVVDEDSRLRRRPVRVEFSQGDFAVVSEGLRGGEAVIVSDPVPALDGMLIAAQVDESLLQQVVAAAEGRTK